MSPVNGPLTTGEEDKCKSCGSGNLTRHFERAEVVCNDCGVVNEESLIDPGQEWRSFSREDGDRRSRTGAPATVMLSDRGLTTEIGWRDRDTYGKSIPSQNRAQLYRLRKWQKRMRASNSTERNLSYALGNLDHLTYTLGLPPSVRNTAAMVYRKAVTQNLVRGRSIDGVVAACVYAASRQCGLPRSLSEIAEKTRISRKEVGRIYRFVARELSVQTLPVQPKEYIRRFSTELRLGAVTEKRAASLLADILRKDVSGGCGPICIAAAAIYIACLVTGEKRTQREVARVARITEVTIRSRYKDIAQKLDIPLPVRAAA